MSFVASDNAVTIDDLAQEVLTRMSLLYPLTNQPPKVVERHTIARRAMEIALEGLVDTYSSRTRAGVRVGDMELPR